MDDALTCSRCKEILTVDHFYRSTRTTRPFTYWCIRCLRAYKRLEPNRVTDRRRALRRRAKQRAAVKPAASNSLPAAATM